MAAGLTAGPSTMGAVILADHPVGGPNLSAGDNIGALLATGTRGPGASLKLESSADLPPVPGSEIIVRPNGLPDSETNYIGQNGLLPEVLLAGATLCFGGLTMTGVRLLRRKYDVPGHA